MTIPEGHFQLYTSITPPLVAGDWRLTCSQELSADTGTTDLDADDLRVEDRQIHFRVKSPRYLMPPDQVLSTFPPANSFGNYGARLPQVVIKRRTLPWERDIGTTDGRRRPWLALVLIAEGEAILETGIDAADCITAGVELAGPVDVEKGNRLRVRKSVIDRVFPTQNDVALLAHAREVDISDTELLLGDDDGFLAVVISNRLPLPGRDDDGNEVPVKYSACLVNLEGQFDRLLERSLDPPPEVSVLATSFVNTSHVLVADAAADDHLTMHTAASQRGVDESLLGQVLVDPLPLGDVRPAAEPRSAADTGIGTTATSFASGVAGSGAAASSARSDWSVAGLDADVSAQIRVEMARDFRHVAEFAEFAEFAEGIFVPGGVFEAVDVEYTFPVLMHWSFTSVGDTTFRSLMEGLDSRLLGHAGGSAEPPDGRLPLEVVETGHVGLPHTTRDGDATRSWYRGPLVPHPAPQEENRLPLAHSSDQLRIVIADGREDLSLAAAFEVGRLLALSQPSIVASLLRWRQDKYRTARAGALLDAARPFWEELLGEVAYADFRTLGPRAGRMLAGAIAENPDLFLGNPRPLVTAGRPIDVDGLPSDVLAAGLGIDAAALRGDLDKIYSAVRDIDTPNLEVVLEDIGTVAIRDSLKRPLDQARVELVADAIADDLILDAVTGPTFPFAGLVSDLVGVTLDPDATLITRGGNVIDNDIIGSIAEGGRLPFTGGTGFVAEPTRPSDADDHDGEST
ncbi:hypothetical protein [Ilumatobacter nonamiensis]|uniref:hypothetical protein n=1 Tax=Ilumatobacter nonamiensis TaxID=467093 RepID=UPI0003471700|nr:hypothetical protein [Ilumatobacter nonamiensis]